MSNAELLIEKIKGLPDDCAAEVLDFVGYLEQKAAKQRPAQEREAVEDGLDAEGECPLCAKYRDPVSGEPRFNAETIAAFEEGDAMLRGEIPANRYRSVAEIWKELDL